MFGPKTPQTVEEEASDSVKQWQLLELLNNPNIKRSSGHTGLPGQIAITITKIDKEEAAKILNEYGLKIKEELRYRTRTTANTQHVLIEIESRTVFESKLTELKHKASLTATEENKNSGPASLTTPEESKKQSGPA